MRERDNLEVTESSRASVTVRRASSASDPYVNQHLPQLWKEEALSVRLESTDRENFSVKIEEGDEHITSCARLLLREHSG